MARAIRLLRRSRGVWSPWAAKTDSSAHSTSESARAIVIRLWGRVGVSIEIHSLPGSGCSCVLRGRQEQRPGGVVAIVGDAVAVALAGAGLPVFAFGRGAQLDVFGEASDPQVEGHVEQRVLRARRVVGVAVEAIRDAAL